MSSGDGASSSGILSGLAPALNLDGLIGRSEATSADKQSSRGTEQPSSSTTVAASRDDAGPSRNPGESHSRPGSILAPSVQFDEQSLQATPSAQRRGANASLPSSPAAGSHFLTASPSVGSKTSLHGRKDANTNQSHASSHHHHRLSSRASAASSSAKKEPRSHSANGTRRSRANPTIVTVPVWARDESPSPPHSPMASPQAHSIPRSLREVESLNLPAAELGNEERAQHGNSTQDKGQILGKSGTAFDRAVSPEAVEQAEAQEAQSTSPDRWWTFTLPQKYRSRLHEHHLRMAFHERMKPEPQDNITASNKVNRSRKDSQSDKRQQRQNSNSDSARSDASSSGDSSDIEMQERTSRERDEPHHGYGFGAGVWNGMAAGLGASGLLNNKHHGAAQSPKVTSPSKFGAGERAAPFTDQQRQASPSPDGTSTTRADDRDLEKQQKPDHEPEYPTMSFKARVENPDVFTVHQPATPGWASPWKPEERGHGGLNAAGYFPRTESGRTIRSHEGRTNGWYAAWKNFLIHNPFVPLLFRIINIAFTSATLAVAIKLLIVLQSEGANDAVGASPLVAIIFAPLSLIHVGFQIWLEYFGRPIGLWTVQSKLSYTVVELIFICLWSSELSLTFDNYFTSTLICVNYGSPYVGPRDPPADRPSPLNNPSRKPFICRLQGSLIGLVFVSLLAYLIVLTVSLFRIFVRVTGGGRR
ncbi:Regulator of phospholipase D SRF1 [Pseudozyma hubeiensis]|nr:Regulator of phospholipase D SRF1 [Pseudozyma hubeiensis]